MGKTAMVLALLFAARLFAQDEIPAPAAEAPGCDIKVPAPQVCSDGAIGDVGPQSFAALSKAEIDAYVASKEWDGKAGKFDQFFTPNPGKGS